MSSPPTGAGQQASRGRAVRAHALHRSFRVSERAPGSRGWPSTVRHSSRITRFHAWRRPTHPQEGGVVGQRTPTHPPEGENGPTHLSGLLSGRHAKPVSSLRRSRSVKALPSFLSRWETDSSRPCAACSSCALLASSHRCARRRDDRYSMYCCTHRCGAHGAAHNALVPFSCQATTRQHHLAAAAASLQKAARRGARRSGIACLTFQRRGCGVCRGAPRP